MPWEQMCKQTDWHMKNDHEQICHLRVVVVFLDRAKMFPVKAAAEWQHTIQTVQAKDNCFVRVPVLKTTVDRLV